MVAAISRDELFDAKFLESVKHLSIVAHRVSHGGRVAEQRSPDLGSGIEFRDFRPYSPGDDFRAIDWNIYRRLGRVFLRLFEELEDLPVYLVTDLSDSVFLENPPRVRAGLRTALALASIALSQHDRVGFLPFGSDLEVALPAQSGKGRLFRFADVLSKCESRGATDFTQSIRRLNSFRLRPGVAVIISDFFDPAGIDAVVKALGTVRHKLVLVQLVRPTDRDPNVDPAFTGDVQLVDCETSSVEDVSITPAVLRRYREAYDRFQDGLNAFARRRSAGLLRLDADREVVPQLATLFETGALIV